MSDWPFLALPLLPPVQGVVLWLAQPASLPSIVLPAGFTLFVLLTTRTTLRDWALAALGAWLTHQLSWVVRTPTAQGGVLIELHAVPAYTLLAVALVGVAGYHVRPRLAFALCWLCVVCADFTASSRSDPAFAGALPLPHGIGGAGWRDALLIEPLLAFAGTWLMREMHQRSPQLQGYAAALRRLLGRTESDVAHATRLAGPG